MNVYLGRVLDSETFHFEHEVCPACSLSSDKEGRLKRKPFKWDKGATDFKCVIPIYNASSNKIVDVQDSAKDLCNRGKLCYLECSRSPDCKYRVTEVKKVVLLDNENLLQAAQQAYRSKY